jgi:hypothetical protein
MSKMTRAAMIRTLGLLAVPLLAMAGAGWAAGQEIDVSRLGPQVGDRLTTFRMADQNGVEHTLESIMGPNGAVVLLFRSADW